MPRFLRFLLWAWLAAQALILAFILATHGKGMEPDLRLVSGAAMVLASFPLSILSMFATLTAMEAFAPGALLLNALVDWAGGVAAGLVQLWVLNLALARLKSRPPARTN